MSVRQEGDKKMSEYVPTPIIPTEPIPLEEGSTMTYEQAERILQLLTDNHGSDSQLITDNQTAVMGSLGEFKQLLLDIKQNTVTVVYDPSKPTGITFQQADDIIQGLHQINEIIGYGAIFFVAYFVVRTLYRFIGGTLFGGI